MRRRVHGGRPDFGGYADRVQPSRPYAAPLTLAGLPEEVRALLGDTPLREPPRQGTTSRVAFTLDRSGDPVVLKFSAEPHLGVLRREHHALRAVHGLGVPAPEPLIFLERSASWGPQGWLVTRRLPGTTLKETLRTERHRARRAALLTDFGVTLARTHATPPPPGFGSADWLEHFFTAARRLNSSVDMTRIERLRHERPVPSIRVLLHGDVFLDNVMAADGRVTGLIDWSFADVGDARFDVAVATHELTRFERDAFAEGYGPGARLTAQEAAYFVEVALLF